MISYDGTTRKPPTAKKLATYKAQVEALSNENLFDDYTEMSGGDYYDGEYTCHGWVIYQLLESELNGRLIEIGFLPSQ